MARILLGLGSNVEPEMHLRAGVQALRTLDAKLTLSPVYQSAALGFAGDDFLNLVACLEVDVALASLVKRLADIEREYGRVLGESRFSAKTLDIDILAFDDLVGTFGAVTLPRDEILQNAFVLKPLADLCGADVHSEACKTYAELWAELGAFMQTVHLSELSF